MANKNRTLIIILSCIIAALLAVLVYLFYSNKVQTEKELQQWSLIEDSHDPDEILGFINEFPDGQHNDQAKQRLEYVKKEIAIWNEISGKEDGTLLRRFMDEYREGKYHELAANALKGIEEKRYNQLHDPSTLNVLMKQIENCYNSSGLNSMIQGFGSTQLTTTYNNCRKNLSRGNECYLLQVNYTDGDMSIKGGSVSDITDNSCKLNFVTYYNGPETREYYGTAIFYMILDGNKWRINDIKEDGYKSSFVKDPQEYVHYAP